MSGDERPDEQKNKVLRLAEAAGPNKEYIAMLENALAEAQKGDFTGGIMVSWGPAGELRTDTAGDFNPGDVVLGMEHIKAQLVRDEFGDADDDSGEE